MVSGGMGSVVNTIGCDMGHYVYYVAVQPVLAIPSICVSATDTWEAIPETMHLIQFNCVTKPSNGIQNCYCASGFVCFS